MAVSKEQRDAPANRIEDRPAGGETRRHRALKEAAFLWAQREGMRACGLEIGLPNCPYRADAAACEIGTGDRRGELVKTAVFECKQSRADLANDNRDLAQTVERLAVLRERRLKLERLLAGHFPHLRRGDSLFAEFESIEIGDLRHVGYRRTVREIRALEKRVYGGTKFERMLHWRVADVFYLVIPRSLEVVARVPEGWGILVAEDEALEDEGAPADLELQRRPAWIDAAPSSRLELLHRIAVSATWQRNRDLAIDWDLVHRHEEKRAGKGADASATEKKGGEP